MKLFCLLYIDKSRYYMGDADVYQIMQVAFFRNQQKSINYY